MRPVTYGQPAPGAGASATNTWPVRFAIAESGRESPCNVEIPCVDSCGSTARDMPHPGDRLVQHVLSSGQVPCVAGERVQGGCSWGMT